MMDQHSETLKSSIGTTAEKTGLTEEDFVKAMETIGNYPGVKVAYTMDNLYGIQRLIAANRLSLERSFPNTVAKNMAGILNGSLSAIETAQALLDQANIIILSKCLEFEIGHLIESEGIRPKRTDGGSLFSGV